MAVKGVKTLQFLFVCEQFHSKIHTTIYVHTELFARKAWAMCTYIDSFMYSPFDVFALSSWVKEKEFTVAKHKWNGTITPIGPPSLPAYLPSSLLACLSTFFHPSLSSLPFLPPFLLTSLPPCLPAYLPPSLPPSLPAYLPPSLPPFLTM